MSDLAECKLLVLGALTNGPKTLTALMRKTRLTYGFAYCALIELEDEDKVHWDREKGHPVEAV